MTVREKWQNLSGYPSNKHCAWSQNHGHRKVPYCPRASAHFWVSVHLTNFHGVNVAAPLQMYTVYILGKHPCRLKLHVTLKCSWALTRDTMVYEIISEIRAPLLLRTPIAKLRTTGIKRFNYRQTRTSLSDSWGGVTPTALLFTHHRWGQGHTDWDKPVKRNCE